MRSTVLVATDGGESADAAASRAIDYAEKTDAALHALYVVDRTYPAMSSYDYVVEEDEEHGESALSAVETNAEGRDLAVTPKLRRGKPFEEILAYTADTDVDRIFMGTNRRSSLERVIHPASTTQRVIRYTHVPVVVVPPAGSESEF